MGDRLVVVGREGTGHELSGDSAELAREVLRFFEHPRERDALTPHIEALSGAPLEHPEVVDQLVELLLGAGALEPSVARRPAPTGREHRPRRVVLGLTGAVGSMHAPLLIKTLQSHGFVVHVAATANALRFVQPEALQALTHRPVVTGLWPTDERLPVPHINLSTWADAVLVCPASATTISRLATANHDCVVSATALATNAPVLVAPSMNPAMYESAGVQRNLDQLVADGMHVAEPTLGEEMADAPERRVPVVGASPPPAVVVSLLETIMRTRPRSGTPSSAEDWDALYRETRDPPWQASTVDADLAEALTNAANPPAAVLDVGTGLGAVAVECARRGHRVVATDLSPVALARAQALAPDCGVVWLEDDITASKLRTTFEIVVDRGCLHLLDEARARDYSRSITRLTAPGGVLIVKTLAQSTAASRAAIAHDVPALLRDSFTLVQTLDTTIPGPSDAPAACMFVLRRTQ